MTPRGGPYAAESSAMVPSVGQKLWGWLLDYAYVACWMVRGFLATSTPQDLLVPATGPLAPVLLIPGVYESWRFLQPVAVHLYRRGHPVHVLDKLGYNTGTIPDMALLVREYLDELDLRHVVVIAHSKGGLIAKYALREPALLDRVDRLVAINTPFSGSRYAYLFLGGVRTFTPRSSLIRQLNQDRDVNGRISSLYSVFDPHIPETSRLEGAQNIILPTVGHFRPLGDPDSLNLISTLVHQHQLTIDN